MPSLSNPNEDFDLEMREQYFAQRLGSRRVKTSDDPMADPQPHVAVAETLDATAPQNQQPESTGGADNNNEWGDNTETVQRTRRTRRKREAEPKPEPSALFNFFLDRRLHIFFGIFCLLTGIVMAVMLVSHFRSGGADQTMAQNLTIGQMAQQPEQIENAAGPLGAWLSNLLFTESLGVGSIAIALYLIIMGITILRRRKLEFWSLTFKTLLVAISTSVVLGLVCYTAGTEINWGGTHGHYINQTLMTLGGPIVAITVSIMLIAALCSVYLNDIIRLYNIWNEKRRERREQAIKVREEEQRLAKEEEEQLRQALKRHAREKAAADISDDNPTTEDDPATVSDSQNVQNEPQKQNDNEPVFQIDDNPVVQPEPSSPANANDEFEVQAHQFETLDNGEAVTDFEPYDHRASLSRYNFPTLDLLDDIPQRSTVDMDEQQQNKDRIIKALADHKVTISSIKATVGPTVTLFEIIPTEGTRIATIKRLEDDIAMSLCARGIRIIAPMPGKGTIGIEVPNSDPQTVSMRQVLASKKFREYKKALPVALGATITNDIFVADLASMPHVLVAGATGQGKSVGLNCLIASLLYKKHPTELKFVLIDPKEVEFSLYAKLEHHYLATLPDMEGESAIITSNDRVLLALNSLCVLMDRRYAMLRKAGVRNIVEYNEKFTDRKLNPENGHEYMPYIVVIIDEFADLIMTAGKEIELPVTRITQKARAVGIHMVIATQRPSTNVLTGLIKANCPTRIAFRVMQMVDSRTILDRPGANQLIGRGDMLYSQGGELERMQCAFISTEEVAALCDFIDTQIGFETPYLLPEPKLGDGDGSYSPTTSGDIAGGGLDRDPMFDECARFIIQQSTASVSVLQRRFSIGYNRAGKIMDQMEAAGIVGPASGSKPRQILMDGMQLDAILNNLPY